MPAAAVIPALIAYIKVVAVKKFVVGALFAFRLLDYREVSIGGDWWALLQLRSNFSRWGGGALDRVSLPDGNFTLNK